MKKALFLSEHTQTRDQIMESYRLSSDRHEVLNRSAQDGRMQLKAGTSYDSLRRPPLGLLTRRPRNDLAKYKALFGGEWSQLRDPIQASWSKLTDADLEQVAGKYDKLVGLLQEKYGYTRERAEEAVNRQIAAHTGPASESKPG